MFKFRCIRYTFVLFVLIVCALIVSYIICLNRKSTIFGGHRKSILDSNVFGRSVYVERIDHLNKICHRYRRQSNNDLTRNKEVLDHILVDSKHQLLYCYVPKVACTNWKRVLMILSGVINTTDVLSIPADMAHSRRVLASLANFTEPTIAKLLTTYTKFLFVRHPFERLVSAFRNKLEPNLMRSKYFQSRLGKYIVKRYRRKYNSTRSSAGDDVTFEEFISYLTQTRGAGLNEHWQAIHSLCSPCTISYDFVGKYETLTADSDFLLRAIGASQVVFPAAPKMHTTSTHLSMYFRRLAPAIIKELYQIYEMDFRLFSYDLSGMFGYEVS
ncbi:carbohydrate sulfotransferase 11 [Rhodnius prolixus]|uniref:carbohydrate sulfotransferase 11 n=1 Tax=Rhodnius prolixus TaxID=13249 RepID=UPI003D18E53E